MRALKAFALLVTLTTVLLGSAAAALPMKHLEASAQLAEGVKRTVTRLEAPAQLTEGIKQVEPPISARSTPVDDSYAYDASTSIVMRQRRRRRRTGGASFGRLRGGSRIGAIAGLVLLAGFVVVVVVVLTCLWKKRKAIQEKAASVKQSALNSQSPSAAAV